MKPLLLALLFAPIFNSGSPATPAVPGGVGSIPKIELMDALPQTVLSYVEPLQTALHELMPYGTYGNTYAPGNCTAYVASRLPIPQSWGNANTWDDYARLAGLTVSSVPKVGAIAESDSIYYLGHVGVVTATAGGVSIAEMNYNGLYSVDQRLINPSDYVYIYF